MCFLVTGGSGFIGTHLLKQLRLSFPKETIVNIDIREPKTTIKNIEFVKIDITDKKKLFSLSFPKLSSCFHLAAICKEPGYHWDEYFKVNYEGTKNVVDLCDRLKVPNIIFTSTMMVFQAGDHRQSEDDLTAPDTAYGLSKLLAEEVLLGWQRAGNRVRIVRPGVVFGYGENGNYTRLYQALRKNVFFYIGRKNTIKGSIYVKDQVKMLIELLDDQGPHTIYHAVWPEQLTIELIASAICSTFGWKRWVPTIPYALAYSASLPFSIFDPKKCAIHPRRIQKLYYSTDISADRLKDLGFEFDYDLDSALADWKKDIGGKRLL